MNIKNYKQFNEGFKDYIYGALLFLASCTSYDVKDSDGNSVRKPVEKTIMGKVEEENWIPTNNQYFQKMKIKGVDGNTYNYRISNTMLTSKSWRINAGDSVRMVFDENGDSQVFKK